MLLQSSAPNHLAPETSFTEDSFHQPWVGVLGDDSKEPSTQTPQCAVYSRMQSSRSGESREAGDRNEL